MIVKFQGFGGKNKTSPNPRDKKKVLLIPSGKPTIQAAKGLLLILKPHKVN
jgi:hypothetical protein